MAGSVSPKAVPPKSSLEAAVASHRDEEHLLVIGAQGLYVDDADGDGIIDAGDRLETLAGETISAQSVDAFLQSEGLIATGSSVLGRRWRDLRTYVENLSDAHIRSGHLFLDTSPSLREHFAGLLSIAQSVAPDVGVEPQGELFRNLVCRTFERAMADLERERARSSRVEGFDSQAEILDRLVVMRDASPALGWSVQQLLPSFRERAARLCTWIQKQIVDSAQRSFALDAMLAQVRLCAEFRGCDPEQAMEDIKERWHPRAQARLDRFLQLHREGFDPLDRSTWSDQIALLSEIFALLEQADAAGIDLGLMQATREILLSRYERLVNLRACPPNRCRGWRTPPGLSPPVTPQPETTFVDAGSSAAPSDEGASLERIQPEDLSAIRALADRYRCRLRSYPDAARGGINFLYGPVLDLAHEGGYMAGAGRTHTDDPALSALFADLTIERTLEASPETIFVIKHAPGIGAITRNPELGDRVVVDGRTASRIAADFAPFARVAARYPQRTAVMIGGAAYPALDGESGCPALYSPRVIAWLRERLPPETILVSDDLGRSILRGYVNRRHAEEVAAKPLNETKFALLEATRAGCDLLLFYANGPQFIDHACEAGRELVAEGAIARGELEDSVRRILLLKRSAHPDHPTLQDIDATVAGMTIDELWAQRLVLPAWNARVSHHLTFRGAGGLAFEGVRNAVSVRRQLQRWLAAHPEVIPPLMADNSPQELADMTSSHNERRASETGVLDEMHEEVRRRFPEGMPAAFVDRLLAEREKEMMDNR